MKVKRIVIVGGGAFARELINWVGDLNEERQPIEIDGFIDDSPKALEGFSYRLPYLGTIDDYQPEPDQYLLMAIGTPSTKKLMYERFKKLGAEFFTLIHPTAIVAKTAILGEGVVVCPLAFISADAKVGNLVAINGSASIGHDVDVGAYSTLSAHVDLTGWVKVGEGVFFGSGARVIPKKRVGSGATIGAGAVVMMNVPDNATIYANPGRRL